MRCFPTPLALLVLLAAAPAALAQPATPVLEVRAGSPEVTQFFVDDLGGLVALGDHGSGTIPATGEGTRMMWHPYKASFRAGFVEGAHWDDDDNGFYPFAGGYNTTASGLASVALGSGSSATANYATALGFNSVASGNYGFAAGFTTTCSAPGCVALGYSAVADADYAVAIGRGARTNGYEGAFVISSGSGTVEAGGSNQFNARFSGGYRLYTNTSATIGVHLNPSSTTWNALSDRNRKEAFEPLDAEALLQRLAQFPLSTWRYRDAETDDRHVGPMAQDWHRLVSAPLRLNADSLTINQGDFDGVNLAGIIALEARTRAQAKRIEALERRLAALEGGRTASPVRSALPAVGLLALAAGLGLARRRSRTTPRA